MLKRTRFRTIMVSWAIATLFVLLSILRFGAYLQVYTLLYSLPILYIHYETERFLKASYVQSQFFLQAIFKQQKREKRNAVVRVNYEKMMEKQQYSREISHLKILIGALFLHFFSSPSHRPRSIFFTFIRLVASTPLCNLIILTHTLSLFTTSYLLSLRSSDNIAHNLRTPIQSINMGIGLLRSEYAPLLGNSFLAFSILLFSSLPR